MRAYVGVTERSIRNVTVGEKPVVTLKVTNFGQTPAYKLDLWAEMEVMDPIAATFPATKPYRAGQRPLNPGQEGSFNVIATKPTPLTATEESGIKSEGLRIYCFGEVQYEDIFRENRFVKFRFETRNDSLFASGHMNISSAGNDAN